MKRVVPFLIALMLASGALAEDWDVHRPVGADNQYLGLSVFVDAGTLIAHHRHANFYNGQEGNANTIYRILHSQAYGQQIWTLLVDHQLISPSAIQHYQQLQVIEFANMRYQAALQLGLGFRYDYPRGWGWLCRFDYAKLNAIGAFLISSTNGTGVLSNNNQYVKCGIYGLEKRINIDLALTKRVAVGNSVDVEFDVGCNLVNTSVQENKIEIAGTAYDILDRWNGQSPNIGSQAYEYTNQGGIGVGGFATLSGCYRLQDSAVTLGYTYYYTDIPLKGHEGYAPQHNIFLRFETSNFHFFD